MIPAEVGGWGKGWCKSMESITRSYKRSRSRLRTLAEGIDVIVLIRKRLRSRGQIFYTLSRGGLPDLISFNSKLVRIGNLFSH